jgi:tRNA G18 (ribose-2'-O)-methylase SpoU
MASLISDPEGYHNFDTRNVADRFKGWEEQDIMSELEATASPFQAWFFNLTSDFNKSTGLRNANCFNAEGVTFVGPTKKWDRRGAVGAHHYTHLSFLTPDEFPGAVMDAKVAGYQIIGVDNVEGASPLWRFQPSREINREWVGPWGKHIFIFGEEQLGLSAETLALCDEVVYIPQLGSVRSLNVGTASGIIMYDFCNKIGLV